MSSERSVRVAGPESLAELVGPVRDILGLPEGEFAESSRSTIPVSARHAPVAGYDYVVTLDPGRLADPQARRLVDVDRQARQVFDQLAASTDWALCLLDHVGQPRVERPAVVRPAPAKAQPLDAGPRPMSSERSVRVAGPESLAELVGPVRDILGLPEGEFAESSWSTIPVSARHAPVAGYDYVVTLDPGRLADPQARRLVDVDRQARQVFDQLAASTDWALCLLDHLAQPRVERPARARIS